MNFNQYFADRKDIQVEILKYLDQNDEGYFQNLAKLLNNQKLRDNPKELKLFFRFLTNIADNYRHNADFYTKIFRILELFKTEIKKYYSNHEIFNIFNSNKRLLLFLLDEKMLTIDKDIVTELKSLKKIKAKYHMYFAPELKPFIQDPQFLSSDEGKYIQADLEKGLPDNFEALRRIGENENRICEIIRKDSISEFISYLKINEYSVNSCVPESICETNSLLLKYGSMSKKEKFTLISYAAYFGSIQIFQYLIDNGAKLRPFLWIHAIHSKRPEIILKLEESSVKFDDSTCIRYLFESIKCYDKNFVDFFLNKYMNEKKGIEKLVFSYSVKYLNFETIDPKMIDDSSLVDFCKNGYYSIVQQLLSDKKCQINMLKSMKLIWAERSLFIYGKYEEYDPEKIEKDYEVTPLYSAVRNRQIDIIKLLLTRDDLDPNIINKRHLSKKYVDFIAEETAFYLAASRNDIEIVKLLLTFKKKVDVNIPYRIKSESNEEIKTAIFVCVDKGLMDMLKILINVNGIDVNTTLYYWHNFRDRYNNNTDQYNKPLLYLALEKGNIEIIKLLLSIKELDVNIPCAFHKCNKSVSYKQWECTSYDDEENMTFDECSTKDYDKPPLYYAVENNRIDYVKLILNNKKIDVNQPLKFYAPNARKEGIFYGPKTPLQCALNNHYDDIAALINQNL